MDVSFEPSHEKTNILGFQPDPTQIGLYSHRCRLDLSRERDYTILSSENKGADQL